MTDTRPSWDEYFLGIAEAVAARADCTRRKVGAVLVTDGQVVSTGYNGTVDAGQPGCLSGACPRGQKSYEEVPEFTSYAIGDVGGCIAVHAEFNAMDQAVARGLTLRGSTIFVTCQPCEWCAGTMKSLGVAFVFPGQTKEG